jgi:3-oxoacyl-[acyl-carrier protein] reductase
MLLENRVVLVTGGSRGIGAATCKLLARHGARVAVNYHQSAQAAQAVVDAIAAEGGTAVAVRADTREAAQVEAMVQTAQEKLGPVDTLVVNAGIGFPQKPFLELGWDAFEAKLLGEIKSAFHSVKALAPGMVQRRQGCIIAVSSGLSRHPGLGFSAHSTAKSGLDALMKSLALELGPAGVRVNVIAPGLTATDATAHLPREAVDHAARTAPLRRIGRPEDIAGAILLLACEEARFVHGAYLPVSGGTLML